MGVILFGTPEEIMTLTSEQDRTYDGRTWMVAVAYAYHPQVGQQYPVVARPAHATGSCPEEPSVRR